MLGPGLRLTPTDFKLVTSREPGRTKAGPVPPTGLLRKELGGKAVGREKMHLNHGNHWQAQAHCGVGADTGTLRVAAGRDS